MHFELGVAEESQQSGNDNERDHAEKNSGGKGEVRAVWFSHTRRKEHFDFHWRNPGQDCLQSNRVHPAPRDLVLRLQKY